LQALVERDYFHQVGVQELTGLVRRQRPQPRQKSPQVVYREPGVQETRGGPLEYPAR
jgi:hypothetical protein